MDKGVTVGDLIKFLQNQQQDLLVAYNRYSEQVLLELSEIEVVEKCKPRPDGWIQDARKDKETQTYLIFPGN